MKKANFLNKIKREGKLESVEPSEEMKASYLKKADNCLKSTKILLRNNLYENSVTESYYAMYNSLLALLYKVGIKSENHSTSIILLKKLFNAQDLFKLILFAKEERIDKQYYVESKQKFKLTEESCRDMIIKAEDFLIGIRLLINRISSEEIVSIRITFQDLLNGGKS